MRNRHLSVLVGISLFFAICGGQEGHAADIRIRSGEHADFSRLVLYFRGDTVWEFGRVNGGFEFRSAEEDSTFHFAGVFDLIPRTRVREIHDLGNGRVFFPLDCDCHGEAFMLPGGQIALDFKDGPPSPANATFNQMLAIIETIDEGFMDAGFSESLELPIESLVTPEPAVLPIVARQGLPLFLPVLSAEVSDAEVEPAKVEIADVGFEPEAAPHIVDEPSVTETVEDISKDTVSDQRVAETEAHLLEQIGRAATQGLLEPHLTELFDPIDLQQDVPDPSTIENSIPTIALTEPEQITGDLDAHVTIVTSIDRATTSETPSGLTIDGDICLDDSLFNVGAWGDDISDGAHLGKYRSGLVGEFDKAQPAAIQSLAEHFVFLTFGAEATALIETFEFENDQVKILMILADIVDNLHSDQGTYMSQYLACDGRVALWSALAQKTLDESQDINVSAIIATFSELPIHLRRYLGPVLATRLIAAGKVETANTLRNAIDRALGDRSSGMGFLDAQLAIDQHQPEVAIAALESVARANTDFSAHAIQDLIEYKISQGVELSEQDISIVSAYAFENRGSDMGRNLARIEILALAETARFSEAFEKLNTYLASESVRDQAEREVLVSVFENLVQKAQDAVFLRYGVGGAIDADLPAEIRFNIASRLFDLGLLYDARDILAQTAQVPNIQERVLYARIALAEEKYDVALGYLVGLDDEVGLALQAQAYAGKEDFSEAAELFARAGDIEHRLQSAWQVGDWQQVAEVDQGALGRASTLMLSDPFQIPDSELQSKAFSTGSQLLAESQRTREIISQLLDEILVP